MARKTTKLATESKTGRELVADRELLMRTLESDVGDSAEQIERWFASKALKFTAGRLTASELTALKKHVDRLRQLALETRLLADDAEHALALAKGKLLNAESTCRQPPDA